MRRSCLNRVPSIKSCGAAFTLACSLLLAGAHAAEDGKRDASPTNSNASGRPNPLSQREQDPFVGTFRSREITVTIEGKPHAFTGTLAKGDLTMKLSGERDEEELVGSLSIDKEHFDFSAALKEGKLVLTSGGEVYALKRVGAPKVKTTRSLADVLGPSRSNTTGALGKPTQPVPTESLPGVAGGLPTMMVTTSPQLGWTIRHPQAWRLHPIRYGLYIIPHDAAKNASGQPEEVLLWGYSEELGPGRSDTASALQYLDNIMSFLYAGFARFGETEQMETMAGPALVVRYAGERHGVKFEAVLHTVIYKQRRLYLAHVSRPALIPKRQSVVHYIVRTIGWQTAPEDGRLLGIWRKGSANADDSTEALLNIRFESGGKFSTTFGRARIGVGNSVGGGAQAQTVESGEWKVADGKLLLVFDSGRSEIYRYQIGQTDQDRMALTLTAAGQPKRVLHR